MAVVDYLTNEDSEVLNLKSSQVACFNVLFPVRENLDWAIIKHNRHALYLVR